MASTKQNPLADRFIPVLVGVSILLAFSVGILWQKVSDLERTGTAPTNVANTGTGTGNGTGQPAAGPQQGKLSEAQAANLNKDYSGDHVRGNANASITLIEYSDLECPFCGRFHETAQQVMDEYGGDVKWIYRHFPLDSIHPQARPAAIASECVAELGGEDAFWNFIDAVFADQTTLSDLTSVATSVGVNAGAFESCVDSGRHADKVEAQYQAGLTAGVTGTPGNFIVNESGEVWLVPGAVPFATIQTTIEEALGN